MAIALGLLALPAWGDDWPQWRGPDRSDISHEQGTLKQWPEAGPELVWLFKDAGIGYSGCAVVGDTLYTMGSRDDFECLIALNVGDGTEKWAAADRSAVGKRLGRRPPRHAHGRRRIDLLPDRAGVLACCRTADGSIVWQVSLTEDFGGKRPNWGYTESVLVDEGKVICTPGGEQGTMLALDRETGEKIWQTEEITDGAHYSSVIVGRARRAGGNISNC